MKINDFYQFPLSIDLEKYSSEYHLRQDFEAANSHPEAAAAAENIMGESKRFAECLPKDYYEYDLKGVLLHSGTAESGHYTSLIREDEGETKTWFEFNDSQITEFKIDRLGDEAFGGQEER